MYIRLKNVKLLCKNYVDKTSRDDLERVSHKKYIKFRWEYLEKLVAKRCTEIQSQTFCANNYLFIESVALEYFKKYDVRKFLNKNTVDSLTG